MFNGPEVWIVLAIILLLFGGSQLPKLARSLGKAQQEFKSGLAEGRESSDDDSSSTTSDTSPRSDDSGQTGTSNQ